MQWRSSTSNFNRCAKRMPWFKPEKMYCMENVLPKTRVLLFKRNPPSGTFLKVEPPIGNTAYREGCSGDSGSGQFVSNDVEYSPQNFARFKFVQVAIFTNTGARSFEYGGETYEVPCGTYSYDKEESKRLNEEKGYKPWRIREYYFTTSMSHKTIDPKALRWIKIRAGICKDDDSCTIS